MCCGISGEVEIGEGFVGFGSVWLFWYCFCCGRIVGVLIIQSPGDEFVARIMDSFWWLNFRQQ